jgi:hypothetical protein
MKPTIGLGASFPETRKLARSKDGQAPDFPRKEKTMIEYATSVGSHNRAKKISRQLLKDRKNQQRGHGDTTGHCRPRRATEESSSISPALAKARTRLLEVAER